MRFYRIYYSTVEGGHYEWFRTKRDAELRYRELKREQEREDAAMRVYVERWGVPTVDCLVKPVCIEFGPNKAEMLRTLNLFCDEGHA